MIVSVQTCPGRLTVLHFRYNTVVVLTVVRYKTCPDHSTVVRGWQVTNFFGSLDQTQFAVKVKPQTLNPKP